MRNRARGARQREERRVAAIDHFVAERPRRECGRRERRRFAGQARGRRVDDQVERFAADFLEPAACGGAESPRERARLVRGAIDHDQSAWSRFDQGREHAVRRAAGAEQQHAPAGDRAAEVIREIAQQTYAVGVVPEHRIVFESQRIDGFGGARTRAEPGRIAIRRFLERQGYVGAAPARGAEFIGGAFETV